MDHFFVGRKLTQPACLLEGISKTKAALPQRSNPINGLELNICWSSEGDSLGNNHAPL
jgi:hypothetical protein